MSQPPGMADRTHAIARRLREQWRMLERVELEPCVDGRGVEARIELNPTLVNAAVEQQGLGSTPATMAAAESRRMKAIGECVEQVNASLPPEREIRAFQVVQ